MEVMPNCVTATTIAGVEWRRQYRRQEMLFNALNFYPKKYLYPIFRTHNPKKICALFITA